MVKYESIYGGWVQKGKTPEKKQPVIPLTDAQRAQDEEEAFIKAAGKNKNALVPNPLFKGEVQDEEPYEVRIARGARLISGALGGNQIPYLNPENPNDEGL